MKLISNFIYYVFITCVVAIALLLLTTLVPIPGNFKVKVVKSGSMEPYIKTGGLVVISPGANYVVGDVITFGKDTKTQIPTTHRIVSVNGEGSLRTFTTKGDANDSVDPNVTRLSDVHGKVIFTLPYAGYVLDFAKQPLGFALLVGVPALLIVIEEIGKIIREIKKMRIKNNVNDDNLHEEKTS